MENNISNCSKALQNRHKILHALKCFQLFPFKLAKDVSIIHITMIALGCSVIVILYHRTNDVSLVVARNLVENIFPSFSLLFFLGLNKFLVPLNMVNFTFSPSKNFL